MSKSLLLMACILTGLLVLACSKAEDTNRNATNINSTNANAATTAPGATTNRNDNGNTNSSATAAVGVAECDTFLTAYEACVTTKVPETVRAQFKNTMTTWRTEWKKLADNPQTRPNLITACKAQMEAARTQMKAYNCTF